MADANITTSFNDGDFDKFGQLSDQVEQHLRGVEAISWLVLGFDKDIPREITENLAENIHTRVVTASGLLGELWLAYRDVSEKLTAATQLIAMVRKNEVDHG